MTLHHSPALTHTLAIRPHQPRGFTLIELMIVVAIIGILAAIAVPAYGVFVTRSQITEGLLLADGLKVATVEQYTHEGTMPADLAAMSMTSWATPNTRYVSALAVEDGAIHVTFGNQANPAISGKIITLQPFENSGALAWRCGNATAPAGTALGSNQTTVDSIYLPASCR